ncbi:HAD family hydrolase [Paraflavitalea sp. CAU 1676]|uniref:D-glycero-alpha-D-manno-heptose-1,7-bisphosphate 7-phosphatase n=1 Tax=Paraflavitalea sp. CAU 1676 TaxID=3032598 RepID=UPI0023D9B076|nr:HAD family hydrolase [Paraflavitalea sp. CAU 1676]MDF2189194.1 HAD family hydrolase [Paraflavitalea sp. CAU 1676]
MLDLKQVDNSWTLFLDRDGVINIEKYQDYVYNYDEFFFYEGALDALRELANRFERIIITTNQKGVGKGLMTEADLHEIHRRMLADITAAGGRIDKIYYCTALENDHPSRKPQPGMAFEAVQDDPSIDLTKSLIVGNNISDMEFGRNAGMFTVFVQTTSPNEPLPNPLIDLAVKDLPAFAKALQLA